MATTKRTKRTKRTGATKTTKTRKATWAVASAAALVGLLLAPLGAEGQRRDRDRDDRAPRGWIGLQLVGADPVGDFDRLVDAGIGGQIDGVLTLDGEGVFRLRAVGGFVVYGHESYSVCFARPIGCRIGVDVTTTNNILFLGAGPEIAAPRGPVRPYMNATGGLSYFETRSSLSGVDDFDDFASTRNFSDLVGAFTVGGGLRVPLGGGDNPVLLDLGATYHRNGTARYLTEGDIRDNPDGSITLFRSESDANLMVYRLGVTLGLGGGGDDDRGRDRRRPRRR